MSLETEHGCPRGLAHYFLELLIVHLFDETGHLLQCLPRVRSVPRILAEEAVNKSFEPLRVYVRNGLGCLGCDGLAQVYEVFSVERWLQAG